jgi:hypothetical protein
MQSTRITSFSGQEGAGTQTSLQWGFLSPSKIMNVSLLGKFLQSSFYAHRSSETYSVMNVFMQCQLN